MKARRSYKEVYSSTVGVDCNNFTKQITV